MKYFLFLILVLNLQAEVSFQEAFFKRWFSTTQQTEVNKEFLKNPQHATPGAWLSLMKISFYQKGTYSLKSDCLFYRAPTEEKSAAFKVTTSLSSIPCQKQIFKKPLAQYEPIRDFSLKQEKELMLVSWVQTNQKKTFYFPYPNLVSSAAVILGFPENPIPLIDVGLGKKTDRYSHGTAILCHSVTDDCQEIIPNKCQHCRWSWYEVMGSACIRVNNKYCGPSYCGQSGEPACLNTTFSQASDYCVFESSAGYCYEGLTVYCEGGLLVCR